MKGHGQSTNRYTVALAEAQAAHASIGSRAATVFKIYTEHNDNLASIVASYFDGASLYSVLGLWQGQTEHGAVIELVSTLDRRQGVVTLAEVIARVNAQSMVLVTWQSSHGFESVNVYGGQ